MAEKPLFLESASFRRRRLGDAARVLPVLAAVLFLLPVMWAPKAVSFGAGVVGLFALWAALILAIRALHHALIRSDAATMQRGEAVTDKADRRDKDRPDAV